MHPGEGMGGRMGHMGPMKPMLTYLFEPADGGTTFTRGVQLEVSGMMRLMQPIMRMMMPKSNAGFVANLKRVLEQESRRA
jgi:hypothetical protein